MPRSQRDQQNSPKDFRSRLSGRGNAIVIIAVLLFATPITIVEIIQEELALEFRIGKAKVCPNFSSKPKVLLADLTTFVSSSREASFCPYGEANYKRWASNDNKKIKQFYNRADSNHGYDNVVLNQRIQNFQA